MASAQEQLVAGIGNYLQQNYGDKSEGSMRKLFDRYDGDGDGKIDKGELEKLLTDIDVGNRFTRSTWVRGIVDKLDTNADRAISWDEFRTVVYAPA